MAQAETLQSPLKPDRETIVQLPVEQLLLDVENPRLAGIVDDLRQAGLTRILWTRMAVDELAWSIAENGFFSSEPLLVIIANPHEEDGKKQQYIVVEGNRRLAAVRLLRDEQLRKDVGATKLPRLDTAGLKDLAELPALIYPDRESLWTAVGFRHINGIKPWDSFSKAEYIAEVHEKYGVALEDIAEKIGDKHATVKRLYRGYKVLQQAESHAAFDKEDVARNRFYFSHLYTATDQREYQDFLGIDANAAPSPEPVPKQKLGELAEFMTWLYGNKREGLEPIVQKQNPDLNLLRKVVSNPNALSVLRRTRSLQRSHDVSLGDRQRFRTALANAKAEIQNAKATVTTGYDGEPDLLSTVDDIIKVANSIKAEMVIEPTVPIMHAGRTS